MYHSLFDCGTRHSYITFFRQNNTEYFGIVLCYYEIAGDYFAFVEVLTLTGSYFFRLHSSLFPDVDKSILLHDIHTLKSSSKYMHVPISSTSFSMCVSHRLDIDRYVVIPMLNKEHD